MGFFCTGGGRGWLIFGPRIFGVLLEPLGMFLGFDFCPSFNHPEHLKSGDPPPWEPSKIIAEDNSY